MSESREVGWEPGAQKRKALDVIMELNSPHSILGFVFTDDCGLKAMFVFIAVAPNLYSQRAALSPSRAASASKTTMIHLCAWDLV